MSSILATEYPARFIVELTLNRFFGHAVTQSPQPLHRSSMNSILAIVFQPKHDGLAKRHFMCHCKERSDEAIIFLQTLAALEIASLCSQ